MLNGKVSRGLGLFVLLAASAGLYAYVVRPAMGAHREAAASAKTETPIPVSATVVQRRDVPVYLDGLGTVQAFSTVTVRTQVDGPLTKVSFIEGSDIHKGDPLAQIDPTPFQAQLDQALAKRKQDEAKLLQDQAHQRQDEAKVFQDRAKRKQDEATLANARVNLKRQENAFATQAVSEQAVEDQRTVVAQLEATIESDDAAIRADEAAVQSDASAAQADAATIQADEAAIQYQRTQLGYTDIRAPIDGRAGIRPVDAGSIVHAGDPGGIVVLTQLQPISVIFTLPQQNLPAINDRLAKERLPVLATGRDDTTELDRGVLELVDNQIDQTTGTIRLKATFPNARRRLWPGGFTNVRLLLDTRRDATTVAGSAIQQGPDGPFVFAIQADQSVDVRPVLIAMMADGDAVIESGLHPGESVVLTGQERLKAGSKVSLAAANGDASGAAPAPR